MRKRFNNVTQLATATCAKHGCPCGMGLNSHVLDTFWMLMVCPRRDSQHFETHGTVVFELSRCVIALPSCTIEDGEVTVTALRLTATTP
jgi:hypothetical protein